MKDRVAEAVEMYRYAVRLNRSATCASCGHQGASRRVVEAQENLYAVLRAEVEREAELATSGTAS